MNKKGFTLTELLVVITIIALISSLSLITFNSARAKARDGKRMNDIGLLYRAIETHIANYGVPPAKPDTWDALATGSGQNSLAGYLAAGVMPQDPNSTRFYIYCRNGNKYLVGTILEQEKDIQGDIDNIINDFDEGTQCVTSNNKVVVMIICDDGTSGRILVSGGVGSLAGGPGLCLGKID